MTRPLTSVIGLFLPLLVLLFLLNAGCIAAAPNSDPRAVRPSACQDHSSLHNRLDVVEKRVEDTVEKLEAEMTLLLQSIEDPKWNPLLDTTGKPVVDILDGQGGEGPIYH